MASTTVVLSPERAVELDEIAHKTGRGVDDLVDEALGRFLDYERWTIARVQDGLREADRGLFASEDEVARVFSKYRDRVAKE
ncbi:CopG family ribbon-helix-helix protein [Marinivivus vitaminiproducens]|uniref:CopG family ribbon-helix-helix protein n=1 Tax=Marinivivus vitaminiproducens TaxID=3035935 RepID=UPI0027A5A49D|nr:hypothetical protein P4R82_15445 [Geminicoccaceae bacterium SCSIO 64248]